jgi:pimeloyl-ACP methyl ester carboxylesterase
LLAPLYFHGEPPRGLFDDVVWRPLAFNRFEFELSPDLDYSARLSALRMPVLVLHGRHDALIPLSAGGSRLAAALPNARLVVFEESGHFPHLEEPDAHYRVVREWLASLGEE